MKRYWVVLFVLALSAIVYQIFNRFLPGGFSNLLSILWMAILVYFGHSMSPKRTASSRWLGKVIIALLVIVIVAYKMNWLVLPSVNRVLNTIGLTGSFLDLLLIYCGWAFFQV